MLSTEQVSFLYQTLGSRIRKLREDKKLKQEYFAKLLGISRTSLINIEQGRQRPPLHNLYEFARCLEVPVHELLPDMSKQPEADLKQQYAQEVDKKKVKDPDKLIEFVKSA